MHSFISALRHKNTSNDPNDVTLTQLTIPLLLENLLRVTVGLVNVLFLSRVSDGVVSAISIANQYFTIVQVIAMSVASGVMVSVNQAIGMHNYKRVNSMATVAIALNTVLGLLCSAFFVFFSAAFLSIMEVEEDVFQSACVYMRIVGASMIFQFIQIIISSLVRSMGKTRMPLFINLWINGVNIIGCALVIFAPDLLGVDAVFGVAMANFISQAVGLVLAILLVRQVDIEISPRYLHPFPWQDLKLTLVIGIPNGANNMAYGSSQLVTTAIITRAGTAMVAAKVYASNLITYVSQIGCSISQANIIMTGYRAGNGEFDEAMKLTHRVTILTVVSNMVCSLLLMAVRFPLLRLFTSDEEIIAIAASIMVVDFVVEIGRALNNVFAGSLQAVGDVVFQLIVNQASAWIISVGLSYVFGIVLGWGLQGVWLAFAIDEMTRGMILMVRWKRQKWLPHAMAHRSQVEG